MSFLFQSFRGYKKEYIKNDAVSGVVIAAVSIPISMGYAQIAGLPAVYGLYGSLLPVLLFAVFSTSPQFIFGVDAAPAAMIGSVISGMGIAYASQEAVALVPVLTLYTGLWLLLFALLRAGNVLNLISMPVMGGFISGICSTIILMQIPKLMGGAAGTGELFELAEHIISAAGNIHPLSLLLGLGALAVLLISKKLLPKFPMAIVVMALGAGLSALLDLPGKGVICLAAVEPGLSPLRLPQVNVIGAVDALQLTLPVALVIMTETLLAENSFALKNDYKLNDNQEILSFALANFASAAVGCCPVNGSVSRSAMNEQFGGKSQLVSLIAALVMALVLLLFTGFIRFLPVPVLTAIVISALMGALEFHMAARLFKADRKEFYIFAGAFLGVLILGTIYGVLLGVVLSFVDVIRRASNPKRDFLGAIPGKPGFYPLERMSEAQPVEGIVIYRFSGNLFFANVDRFQNDIENSIKPDTRAVIVDASGIVSVDTSAADRLVIINRKLRDRGVAFYLTEHIGQLNDELRRFGAEELISGGAVRRTMYAALIQCDLSSEQADSLIPAGQRDGSELLRELQEFEWAYGGDAEEKMEALAGEVITTLEHTEQSRRESRLDGLLHEWRFGGAIDRDEVLIHLEKRLGELSKLLNLPEDSVLQELEHERETLINRVRQEHPELAMYLSRHKAELEEHFKEKYPSAARHIAELREKHGHTNNGEERK